MLLKILIHGCGQNFLTGNLVPRKSPLPKVRSERSLYSFLLDPCSCDLRGLKVASFFPDNKRNIATN